jgi:hypothetical protein
MCLNIEHLINQKILHLIKIHQWSMPKSLIELRVELEFSLNDFYLISISNNC